jgi:hypothetical protein
MNRILLMSIACSLSFAGLVRASEYDDLSRADYERIANEQQQRQNIKQQRNTAEFNSMWMSVVKRNAPHGVVSCQTSNDQRFFGSIVSCDVTTQDAICRFHQTLNSSPYTFAIGETCRDRNPNSGAVIKEKTVYVSQLKH